MAFYYQFQPQRTLNKRADCCRHAGTYSPEYFICKCLYTDNHGNSFHGTICHNHMEKVYDNFLRCRISEDNARVDMKCNYCEKKAEYVVGGKDSIRSIDEPYCNFYCEDHNPNNELPPKAASKTV